MDNTKRLPGRARSAERPIHPSWTDYVAHFDPTNPTRSQNAFCAWAGVRPSSLSAAKRKPITDRIELKLSEWIEEIAWSEAPPWAKWRAQDKDGWWCFYKYEPCVSQYDWVYSDIIFSSENYILSKKGTPSSKWKTTLQKRPENE